MKHFWSLVVFFKVLIPVILGAEPWPFARINVMGDSHSYFSFTGDGYENPNWQINGLTSFSYIRNNITYEVPHYKRHVGPRLMYSFGVKGCEDRSFIDITPGEYLVFVFGEIDIRGHIKSQIAKGRLPDEIIDNLVTVYFHRIKKISDEYKIIPIIFCPIPPVSQGLVAYNNLLKNALRKKAQDDNILIFDILDKYSDSNGELIEAYRDKNWSHVHIDPSVNYPVREALCNLIWDYEMSK